MRTFKHTATTTLALLALAGTASAEGELQIYNWGDYTSPEMIEKFEAEYDIDVVITDYDSNDTALAKVRQGGHGFDIVVPTSSIMPVWIEEGLLMKSEPNELENFKNVDPQWVDVSYDPGRHYSIPYAWGTTGVSVNTSVYDGDINTAAIFLEPPEELWGKINVLPEMSDVMAIGIHYVGGESCTTDLDVLKNLRDLLVAAKPHWLSMDYGVVDSFISGDISAGTNWNGSALRARRDNPDVLYGYPATGYPIWMDNVAILADAKNVENAKLFMNFMMDPENVAMNSAFNGYANGIMGSEEFMPEDMRTAPEIVVPADLKAAGFIDPPCSQEANDLYVKIWTELMK